MIAKLSVALFLWVPFVCSAANWVEVAEGKDFAVHSVDLESIEVVSREEGLVSAEHVVKDPHRHSYGSNVLRVILHHCIANKTEIVAVWHYEKGRKLAERELPEYLYKPMDLRPGSVGEVVHKFVCAQGARGGS